MYLEDDSDEYDHETLSNWNIVIEIVFILIIRVSYQEPM